MKKLMIPAVLAVGLASGFAIAGVKDWHDLDNAHHHIVDSIHEMERARAANHYDMAGHGAKAEALLRDAEKELGLAVEAAKGEK